MIVGASFTMSDYDLYKMKNNEHYNDIHKIIYDQYFKDYNQQPHHHHHHHHHKHKSHHHDQDHDRDQDRDHQDHDHDQKDTNDKTISSSWIYDQLKQYLTCIYDKQINCEDQFVTKLQLELLKLKKKKEKYENVKIKQQQQQTPILTVKLDTKQPYTKRIHEKGQKETRYDSSIIYQLNNRKEIEKSEEFTTHEFYQSLDKDKHLNYYHHEHHDRDRDHRDDHRDHHPHPHPFLDHHRHKDHHRSSSHYEYGWFDKMDDMMKKLEDDKHDDDDDDDDDDGRKGKDKHSDHPPTYRKHLHKY
uniref:GATA zinc finger domain-containing protein 14-like n=1 Tax=Schistosoma mansoni TaxID=6183 RepID=A0A5K4FAJ5_SCHMA